VDPLSPAESQELAAALVSRGAVPQGISVIAAEAGGSPFFIAELVRFAESADGESSDTSTSLAMADSAAREATLANVIQIRISRLPSAAQRLLQLVAVNGRPMRGQVLQSMAGVGILETEGALALLRSERLVRGRDTDRGVEFESYHDRIRDIVVSSLDADERRECHRRLADAWEQANDTDAQLLAEHWLGASDVARAAHYTGLAAEEAERALAFDRAVRLYERTLDLLHPTADNRPLMMVRFARALANAGRSAEAAAVYLAIPSSTPAEALDFRQKAAQHLLFAGHLDEGLRIVRTVLSEVGMKLPETRSRTLLALITSRLRVRMRGLRYRECAADAVPPGVLTKVDACWAVAAGLSVVDTMRGAVFQARHLLLALDAGEIERVHRALCLEAGFLAAGGSRTTRSVERIRTMAAALTERIGTPYARAMDLLTGGVADYLVGRWTPAAAALTEAERLLMNECTGVTWELDCSRLFGLWSLFYRGDVSAIAARFPVLLRDADDRGDLYVSTTIRGLYAHIVYLAAADPDVATRHTRDAIEKWSHASFDLAHFMELWSSTDIALYQGRGLDAWMKLDRAWPSLRRSLLMEVQMHRVSMLDLRARAALLAAAETRPSSRHKAFLRTARRCARAMERQRADWASAMALMLHAGIYRCQGHDDLARALFDRAHRQLASVDMYLMAAVAGRRHGELVGGDAGRAEVEASEVWMRGQAIRDPAAMSRMFVPV
jgi:tetratricopeptide (TPR) repeat protein